MDIKSTLDELVARYNTPSFIAADPVQFPRRFSDKRDIEISAFATSAIAWGRRTMILRNAEKIHDIMGWQPLRFVLEGDIDSISDANIHRTFFGRHFRYMLRGLREIYGRYGSLEDFAIATGAMASAAPAWKLAEEINRVFSDTDAACGEPLDGSSRCLPSKPGTSALKRLNMALRWLVRNDGIVDMGVWTALTPAQLSIPLDVHSGRTARSLGLLTRSADDRQSVDELTANLRILNPTDPVVYDFALFGFGVENG